LSGVTRTKVTMLDTLRQDVKYAARSLVRRPLVTTVAVLSLALGIGVNTAIFSVFERLLLRQLPVQAPHQIVNVTSPGPRPGSRSTGNAGGQDEIFSYPLFRDLERLDGLGLSRIAAHREFAVNLAHDGRTERADGLLVSGGYFPALGVRPALGRLLTPDDDRVDGGHPLVVLAHDYWTTRFGADPNVLGRGLTVNGQRLTVVGVAPAGFRGTTTMDAPHVFVPVAMGPQVAGLSNERNNHSLYLFARLQAGTTLERAQTAVNGPFGGIIRDVEFPVQRRGLGDRGREQFLARRIVLTEGARGRNSGRREATLILGLMLTVTGLVLLIACANVANLLLARAADRTGEMAVRLSIGGSSRRLLRLLLVEAALLGGLGAAGALAVGKGTSVALLNMLPADDAQVFQFEFNRPLLLFTLLLGLGAAMLFGIYPALQSVRAGVLASRTNSGRSSPSRSAARFRTSLATGQIALATVLLALAGLFLTSLVNIGREELGLRREGLIGFRLSPYLNGYTPERALVLFDSIEEALGELPGVVSVTGTTVPLLADADQGQNVTVEGFNAGADDDARASFARTGTDYFQTLGTPLLAGREFSRADDAAAPKVAIVNEAFARKFGLGADAVGKRMALGAGDAKVLDIEIVGLVRDAKYSEVREPAPPQFFLPYRQGAFGSLTFYVRSGGDPGQLRTVIPALVARADPNLPVERLRTMDDQIWDNLTPQRVFATLSSSFAVLAVLLAAIGLYAMLAYSVTQRLKEIGIRLAVGARPGDVQRMLFAHMGRMTLFGGGMGVVAAFGMGRLVRAVLFGVDGSGPILLGAAAVIASVAFAAAVIPAYRASRVNPVLALRAE
jgi:predicted permease